MTMTSSPGSTPTARARSGSSSSVKPKKKSTALPQETVDYLRNWILSPEHIAHPYPTEQEKAEIMADTGIELKQLTNWFVNNRKRFWKPRIEAKLLEQGKSKSRAASPSTSSSSKKKGVSSSPDLVLASTTLSKAISKVVSSSSVAMLDDSGKTTTAATTVTPFGSPGRITSVSETSSTASDSGSVTSTDDETMGEQEHTIRIDLHILKPVSGKDPTEADMTTLSNISTDKILRSFRDCYITYRIPANATLLQEQKRRDAELFQLKTKLLAMYFAEKKTSGGPSTPTTKNKKKRSAASSLLDAVDTVTPRPKYRRVSLDTWKLACKTASHVYDDEALPSLEEATQLFGYAAN